MAKNFTNLIFPDFFVNVIIGYFWIISKKNQIYHIISNLCNFFWNPLRLVKMFLKPGGLKLKFVQASG